MMVQQIVDVSVVTTEPVASAMALITKLVPAVIVPTDGNPSTTLDAGTQLVNWMTLEAVTADVLTVTVPLDSATRPAHLAPALLVVAPGVLTLPLKSSWNSAVVLFWKLAM